MPSTGAKSARIAAGLLSTKGQVTIPQEIRQSMGLKEGDRIEFVTQGGQTIIRPGRSILNPFDEFVGALGTFPGGKEEINSWVAELRDE